MENGMEAPSETWLENSKQNNTLKFRSHLVANSWMKFMRGQQTVLYVNNVYNDIREIYFNW